MSKPSILSLAKIHLLIAGGLLAAACSHLPPADEGVRAPGAPGLGQEVIATPPLDDVLAAAFAGGDLEAVNARLEAAVAEAEAAYAADALGLAAWLGAHGAELYNAFYGAPEAWELGAGLIERERAIYAAELGEASFEVSLSLDSLAQIHQELGRWSLARSEAEKVLEIRRALLDDGDPDLVDALYGLAALELTLGRYGDARSLVAEARGMPASGASGEAATDPVVQGDLLGLDAEIHRVLDRLDDAERLYGEAVAALGEADDFALLDLLNNQAGLYKDQRRYDEAEVLLRRVRETQETDLDVYGFDLPTTALNQAEVLRLQGRLDEAEPLYARALDEAREMFGEADPQLVEFLSQRAVLMAETGRSAAARKLYDEALALMAATLEESDPRVAQTLHDYGDLERGGGRLDVAERLYRRALAIREDVLGPRHPELAWTLTELARALVLGGRAGEALQLLDRALDVFAGTTAYPEVEVEARALRAEILAAGDPRAAIGEMARALDLVEEMRPRTGGDAALRAEFLGRYAEAYERMVSWQLAAGRPDAALDYAERFRARVLLDQLAAARVDLDRGIPPQILAPLAERDVAARQRLAEAQGALDRLDVDPGLAAGRSEADLVAAIDDASRELQLVAAEKRRVSPLWNEVLRRPLEGQALWAEVVPEDGLLLLYQVGREASHLFVVSPGGAVEALELRLADGTSLTRGVLERSLAGEAAGNGPASSSGGRGLLKVRLPAAEANTASEPRVEDRLHRFWQALVPDGLWPRLRAASEVVVIPDGALHGLPFEALVTAPGDGSRNGHGARYWLDDGPVVRYAASATALARLTRRPSAVSGGVLVVADPVFGAASAAEERAASATRGRLWGGGLAPLPGTAREAAAIRGVLGERAAVLERTAADEPGVRRALGDKPGWVHFATHGLVDEGRHELLAGLALTPGSGTGLDDDGLLQLFEIYELDLAAELAVLSACDSNVGRRLSGEGVFALSRGFLAAGARRVVASQWAVDDASTAELMGEFYRRLAAGEGYATALRDARRAVRREDAWSDPYYWAPFVLVGAP